MKHWMKQIGVFVAWLVNILLGFWVMVVLRQTLLSTLAAWYVGDSMPRAWRARFYDRAFFVLAGLVYLIFIFAIDGYLRDGLKKGDTFRRFVKVIAIELLILFPADLLTSLVQESALGQLSLLLLILELLLGGALLAYAILNHPKRKRRFTRGEIA